MTTIIEIRSLKTTLRAIFKTKRKDFYEITSQPIINRYCNEQACLMNKVLAKEIEIRRIDLKPEIHLALYHPLPYEADCLQVTRNLTGFQYKYFLPCIESDCVDKILKFREFNKDDDLIVGKWNILQPKPSSQAKDPDIIITPFIAFDKRGYRLGYGQGYYDSTIYRLKDKNPNLLTIGLGYNFQKYEADLPTEEHDLPLDYVITERSLYSRN